MEDLGIEMSDFQLSKIVLTGALCKKYHLSNSALTYLHSFPHPRGYFITSSLKNQYNKYPNTRAGRLKEM